MRHQRSLAARQEVEQTLLQPTQPEINRINRFLRIIIVQSFKVLERLWINFEANGERQPQIVNRYEPDLAFEIFDNSPTIFINYYRESFTDLN